MAMRKRYELERCLAIDRDNLDEELVRHPQLFFEVAAGACMAMSERDSQKDYIKSVEGRIGLQARSQLEKPTEKAVEQAVSNNSEYCDQREKYLALCQDSELWFALKEAFQARGYALHNLAGIYTARLAAEGGASYGAPRRAPELPERTPHGVNSPERTRSRSRLSE